LPFGDELEAEFLTFPWLYLHIRDFGGGHHHLAEELFAADHLHDQRPVVLGLKVPMKVVVVEEDRVGRSGPQDAVRMVLNPFPQFLEGESESDGRLGRHHCVGAENTAPGERRTGESVGAWTICVSSYVKEPSAWSTAMLRRRCAADETSFTRSGRA